ncbi:MAG TPA: hypothetical protein VGQ09_19260 [Chitinophagaceae bacterium]|jgi:hypothetical protein|nr:hypothetical protein [Chitinophagaceae bacterium]
MKKLNFLSILIFLALAHFLSGCYKLQTDYNYVKSTLDPHINMTAKDFMNSRGKGGVGSDTIFKWMQLGIEYAGIDMAEYEKPGRTFIFLTNSSIRTTSGSGASLKVTGGFFFDFPIIAKDASGNVIKSKIDPTLDSTRPALQWSEYSKETVKNYLLYFIIDGVYGFDNLGAVNQSVPTLLPAGAAVSKTDSKLSWVITKTTPNPNLSATTSFVLSPTLGTGGFDPEGKMNLKLANTQDAPIVLNDRVNDRTAGYIATNGQIHVFGATLFPFRYSWL